MGNYFVTSVEIVISAVFKDSRRSTCGLIWIKSQKVKRCTETESFVCVCGGGNKLCNWENIKI